MFLLCAEIHQAPPPTLPVTGGFWSAQCRAGATATSPFGVLIVPWNTAPPYHDGPGSISTLAPCCFTKSGPNSDSSDMVLLATMVSISFAALTQVASEVLTVMAVAPVT